MSLSRSWDIVSPVRRSSGTTAGTHVFPRYLDEPTFKIHSTSEILGLGTTAIARTTPNNPVFSGANFLGELRRDGVPDIPAIATWRDRTLGFKNLGDEYLNVEFGWLPFVSDIKNFARAVKNQHQIIRDFQDNSGKNIHVDYSFPEFVQHVTDFGNIGSITGHNVTQGSQGGHQAYSYGYKSWFAGCFTYYLPVGKDQRAKAQRFNSYADKLYGVRLTPEVLWNLAPWSWAIDWFSNTGDILHNVSMLGQDGLVLRYGYMMHHRWFNSLRVVTANSSSIPAGGRREQVMETKKRFPSTPYYGFGAAGSLSATQTAILAALGMSKGGRLAM